MKLIDKMGIEVDPKIYTHTLQEAELIVDDIMARTDNGISVRPSPNVGGPTFCISCMGIAME